MSDKLLPCKDCGQMVAKNARVCPGCGRRSISNLWNGCAMFVVILILIGVLNSVCRRVTHRVIEKTSSAKTAKGL